MNETFRRLLRFGLNNYIRNGWLSVAATLVVALTLFIVSVFVLQSYVIKSTTKAIEDKLDMAIYINDTPSEEAVGTFITEIKALPEVKELVYLNKQQVMEEWNKLHVDQKIKSQVNSQNNPLPRTIKVKANDPTQLDRIAEHVNKSSFASNIRNMSYRNNRPVIQQLVEQSRKTVRNGIIVSTIFVLIAVAFVYNTIRIIIRFRHEEISIMKLVGATDSFIRGPFIVEGTLYGVAAGVISLVALYFYLQNGLSESSATIASPDAVMAGELFALFQSNIIGIGAILISVAIVLAIFCSWISVQQNLKR